MKSKPRESDSERGLEKVPVVVTLDGAAAGDPAIARRVLQGCRQAGLDVERDMTGIGVVSGRISSDRLTRLRAVRHVEAVEPDQERHVS